MNNIFSQIKTKDSAFASVSLPLSVSTQGTYLNQLYVGMFRPDGLTRPRWFGNLKQYRLDSWAARSPCGRGRGRSHEPDHGLRGRVRPQLLDDDGRHTGRSGRDELRLGTDMPAGTPGRAPITRMATSPRRARRRRCCAACPRLAQHEDLQYLPCPRAVAATSTMRTRHHRHGAGARDRRGRAHGPDQLAARPDVRRRGLPTATSPRCGRRRTAT